MTTMKISELIEHLACLLAENGDIEVKCWPYDGQQKPRVPQVQVVELEDGSRYVEIDEEDHE